MTPRHGHLAGPCPLRAGRAFTLIEMLITLALAALMLGLATARMRPVLEGRSVAVQADVFLAAVRHARSEALKRGEVVTLCARVPARQACRDRGTADWQAGWLEFVDRGERGRLDDPDQLLRSAPALVSAGAVSGTRASISFMASGISLDAASHYEFLPPSGDLRLRRLVCVSKQGRARLAAIGAGTCD